MRAHRTGPRVLALLLALASGGCLYGRSVHLIPPANGPCGIRIGVEPRSGRDVRGELLAMGDSGVLILDERESVVLVPWGEVRRLRTATALGIALARPPRPGEEAYERLRLHARYPQGVTADQLERLLAALGQDTVRVARRE